MQKKYGEDPILDPKETTETDLKSVHLAVYAIIVNKNSDAGAVTGNNVITEPKQVSSIHYHCPQVSFAKSHYLGQAYFAISFTNKRWLYYLKKSMYYHLHHLICIFGAAISYTDP